MTPEHDALLAAACDNPADILSKLALADWLAEHGLVREEAAWRWIAAFRRGPCMVLMPFRQANRWGWIKDPLVSKPWPQGRGWPVLPRRLFSYLKGGVHENYGSISRHYETTTAAYLDLVLAFMDATKPRGRLVTMLLGKPWEPDWSLVSKLPEY